MIEHLGGLAEPSCQGLATLHSEGGTALIRVRLAFGRDFLKLHDDFFQRLQIVDPFDGIQLQRFQNAGQSLGSVNPDCGLQSSQSSLGSLHMGNSFRSSNTS